jgi:hypothetical protein
MLKKSSPTERAPNASIVIVANTLHQKVFRRGVSLKRNKTTISTGGLQERFKIYQTRSPPSPPLVPYIFFNELVFSAV